MCIRDRPNGVAVRAWQSQRVVAGKQREVVVVFSPQLHEGQLRGLHQSMARSHRELAQMGQCPRLSAEAAKRKLEKIRGHQYLRSLLDYKIDTSEQKAVRICVWSD